MEPKKCLVIENGVIVNIVVATEDYANEQGWQIALDPLARIGCSLIDGKWVHPDDPTPAQLLEQNSNFARLERDRRLRISDWTQVPDAPVDQAAWAAYRQALRDIPSQAGFPWDIQWPTQPE